MSRVNNKDTMNSVNGVFIFDFIINFMYSGVFIVNFEHISHFARREKCQNTCFILQKKSKFCRFQIEVFPLPPYPTSSSEYRPIKFALCPYIRLGHINGILRYFLLIINKLSCLHLWEIIIPNYNTLGKAIPNHKRFWEIIIPKHNTIWER